MRIGNAETFSKRSSHFQDCLLNCKRQHRTWSSYIQSLQEELGFQALALRTWEIEHKPHVWGWKQNHIQFIEGVLAENKSVRPYMKDTSQTLHLFIASELACQ